MQSSGVAEWTSLCGAVQFLQRQTTSLIGYASLVRACKAPPRSFAASAAMRRGAFARLRGMHPQRALVSAICKGKAHVDASNVAADAALRIHAIGNAAADAADIEASLRHPLGPHQAARA